MALDFALSDEHTLVRSAVKAMLQKYIPPPRELREMARTERKMPEELWQDYAGVGLTGCLVPEEYGGNNMGLLALTLGFEEIISSGFSPGPLILTAMVSGGILKNGTEEQKGRFLPEVAEGNCKFAFAGRG